MPVAYEKASREQRLRAEMDQAKRENKAFVENVVRSKMIERIKEKRKNKMAAEVGCVDALTPCRRSIRARVQPRFAACLSSARPSASKPRTPMFCGQTATWIQS